MKTLSSFRLTQIAKQNLEYLAKKYKMSQADIIAETADFLSRGDYIEDAFNIFVNAHKLERNKNFQKWKAEYDRADPETQKIMWKASFENNHNFDE